MFKILRSTQSNCVKSSILNNLCSSRPITYDVHSRMKADLAMTDSSNVFECPASYYNPATKKWESGCFTLNRIHIQFVNNSLDKNEPFHLCLPLSMVTGIEKRQSNFIYPSLVVCVGSEKHWFGSFANRDAVYNLLELFWREALISRPHIKPNPIKVCKTNSPLGKELLGILNESENILIETANDLSDQNWQLYDVEEAVEDLNDDLAKAEDAVKCNSLLQIFPNVSDSDKDNTSTVPELPSHKYKVTFSFSNIENKTDWEKGILVVSNDIISLKVEENTLMQVTKDELEAIKVLSPWEICIVHSFSGIRKSCFFMCPQLSRLLKFISSIPNYKEKINYIDDDSSAYETASCYSSSSFGSAANTPSSPSSQSNSFKKLQLNSSQTQDSNNTLSEEEIQELSSVLENLKILATEVNREQVNQMERISALVENTENTRLKIKDDEKDLKKQA